jgi:hypothetical protein
MLIFGRQVGTFIIGALYFVGSALANGDSAEDRAQGSSDTPTHPCVVYQLAAEDRYVLSDALLTSDLPTSMKCLMDILAGLTPSNQEKTGWKKFIWTTGAMRIVIASADQETPNRAISFFRRWFTLDMISALAFGARSNVDTARVNATLILGNVVDNDTLCVPLDHLYDPKVFRAALGRDDDSQVRGRANLLSVISVVAPWAYQENFNNIQRVYEDLTTFLSTYKARPELAQTFEILERLRKRLDYQDTVEAPNKNTKSPGLLVCKRYKPLWAGKRLIYPD